MGSRRPTTARPARTVGPPRSRPGATARRTLAALAAGTIGLTLAAAPAGAADRVNTIGGCQVFPGSNAWNQRVDGRPKDPRSDRYVARAGSGMKMTATYGTTSTGRQYSLPINIVGRDQPGIAVHQVQYDVDPGLYPISFSTQIGGGYDRHAVVLQRGTCRLFELWHAGFEDGRWVAGSGSIWNLRRNPTLRQGRTSANAAGLPILPGLLNRNDAHRRRITHAIAVTLPVIQDAWVSPATHTDGLSSDPDVMPMGTRLRMRAGVRTAGMPRQARIIAQAMKRYGLIVSDTGGPSNGTNYDGFNISGEYSPAWDEASRRVIEGLRLGDFEVVRPSGRLHRRGS